MTSPVKLSSGESVHFKPWKRKAAKLFKATLKDGVHYRRNLETGLMESIEEIPANNFDLAYERVIPILIEKIEKGGSEIPFTNDWLDDLLPVDYDKLEAAVHQLKEASQEEGEKNTRPAEKAS